MTHLNELCLPRFFAVTSIIIWLAPFSPGMFSWLKLVRMAIIAPDRSVLPVLKAPNDRLQVFCRRVRVNRCVVEVQK